MLENNCEVPNKCEVPADALSILLPNDDKLTNHEYIESVSKNCDDIITFYLEK